MKRWTEDDQPLDPSLINVDDRLAKGTIGRTAQMYDDPDAPEIVLLTPLSLAVDVWHVIATAADTGRLFRLEAHARGQAVTDYEDDWKVRGAGDTVEITDARYEYGEQHHAAADAARWFRTVLDVRRTSPTEGRDEFGHEFDDRFYLYEPFAPARATAEIEIVEADGGPE